MQAVSRLAVLICGAGIAGVESALRLRRLAADRVDITLVDPGEELIYRPLAVGDPFALGGARRYSLQTIAERTGTQLVRDGVLRVDPAGRTVFTSGGTELAYDALLLAPGGRQVPPLEHVQVFTDANAGDTFSGIVQDIEGGYLGSLVLIEPEPPTWPLPIYELALMTAARAYDMSVNPQITVITPEARPLEVFGEGASERVEALLREAGVAIHTRAIARVPDPATRRVRLEPAGTEVDAQRVVTVPRILGPAIQGLPATGPLGELPVDEYCRLQGGDGRIFAAGDATDFPVKQGGIGAQQGDTAAAGIAALAGAGQEPTPFRPVLRGMLLTGRDPLYLSAEPADGQGWASKMYRDPPWPADEKVVAEELGPFLKELDGGS
jgi:sulfide:quinone oxidoreductase